MDDRQVEAALCGRVQRDARCTRTACAHRGGQEVRPRARRDVELGPGHDVALALFDGTGRQTGRVGAAARFGDGQSDDRLAAQDGPGDPLDLRRIVPSSPAAAADRWRLRGSAPSSSHRRR
jgi:hypothetical protein